MKMCRLRRGRFADSCADSVCVLCATTPRATRAPTQRRQNRTPNQRILYPTRETSRRAECGRTGTGTGTGIGTGTGRVARAAAGAGPYSAKNHRDTAPSPWCHVEPPPVCVERRLYAALSLHGHGYFDCPTTRERPVPREPRALFVPSLDGDVDGACRLLARSRQCAESPEQAKAAVAISSWWRR